MAVPLLTYRDVIDHLLDFKHGAAQDVEHRTMKRAVRAAWRDLHSQSAWSYALREYQINLQAAYSTGTIEYDFTGGANERQVTLTTGTWPTWAASGRIKIASKIYEVDQRVSNSVITLDSVHCPQSDIASGTSYTLFQNTYAAPDDFGGMIGFHDEAVQSWGSSYIAPDEWSMYDRNHGNMGQPFYWTVLADPERPGGWMIATTGYPSSAKPLWFLYRRRMAEPTLSGLESKATSQSAGTVALTSGSATVTGTSTAFDSSMIGSVMRVSANASEPTSSDGLNAFATEYVIRSVSSATSLTLKSAATETASGKGFVISSLLDIPPFMHNALLRGAEHQWALLAATEPTMVSIASSEYKRAVRRAKEDEASLSLGPSSATMSRYRGVIGDRGVWDFGTMQVF